MGRVAQVLSYRTKKLASGMIIGEVKADFGGGDSVTARHYQPPGEDAFPLPGDFVFLEQGAEQGRWLALGFADPKFIPVASAGEYYRYSRDPLTGLPKSSIYLKSDGTCVINGLVEIDQLGNIKTPAEVSAKAATPATEVKLSTHLHPHPFGPTSPPTPGT
jgi:hypothetical protein